jgi:hypothetical protein
LEPTEPKHGGRFSSERGSANSRAVSGTDPHMPASESSTFGAATHGTPKPVHDTLDDATGAGTAYVDRQFEASLRPVPVDGFA